VETRRLLWRQMARCRVGSAVGVGIIPGRAFQFGLVYSIVRSSIENHVREGRRMAMMTTVRRAGARNLAPLLAVVAMTGCMMVGPDYQRPTAPVASSWIPREGDGIAPSSEPIGPWWESFGDPTMSNLIAEAYLQNPSLQAAGVRVIEAQARRGIAIGTLFPQTQNLVGAY